MGLGFKQVNFACQSAPRPLVLLWFCFCRRARLLGTLTTGLGHSAGALPRVRRICVVSGGRRCLADGVIPHSIHGTLSASRVCPAHRRCRGRWACRPERWHSPYHWPCPILALGGLLMLSCFDIILRCGAMATTDGGPREPSGTSGSSASSAAASPSLPSRLPHNIRGGRNVQHLISIKYLPP